LAGIIRDDNDPQIVPGLVYIAALRGRGNNQSIVLGSPGKSAEKAVAVPVGAVGAVGDRFGDQQICAIEIGGGLEVDGLVYVV
jgi:hypothetical protein